MVFLGWYRGCTLRNKALKVGRELLNCYELSTIAQHSIYFTDSLSTQVTHPIIINKHRLASVVPTAFTASLVNICDQLNTFHARMIIEFVVRDEYSIQ